MLKQANPEYILEKATNQECPQQYNGFDCGLFLFGILLHIANNVPVTSDVFSSSNVTRFHQGPYTALVVPAGGRTT
jgi:Ulp1 family protease